MVKFYEKTELSDVICEEWYKLSDKIIKAIKKKHQSVLKPLIQLKIFLQISEYNFQRYEYCKNKTRIAPPAQYSMSFTCIDGELLYIIVSI